MDKQKRNFLTYNIITFIHYSLTHTHTHTTVTPLPNPNQNPNPQINLSPILTFILKNKCKQLNTTKCPHFAGKIFILVLTW